MSNLLDCLQPVMGNPHRVVRQPIDIELDWRSPGANVKSSPDLLVLRWTHRANLPLDVTNAGHESLHCVALNLKCTSVNFEYAGRPLIRGRVPAGVAHVGAPGVAARASFAMPCDVLHLYVSQQVIGECYEDLFGRPHCGEIVLGDERLLRDPAIERLGQALAVSQTNDTSLGKVFTDSVSLAIISRLVSRQHTRSSRVVRTALELPKWRMTRVMDFIDAHLGEPIGLAEMAESAGLTRMHFAAQFRQASGLRPHEYLLRRRIEHSQSLLLGSSHNVLDVALSCGFRSQAHFTTVFKRFVGETPFSWRKSNNGLR
jgi:AraC family transcriptional regulator